YFPPFAYASAKSDQLVAQAGALAVQDATDNLRNTNTVGIAAIGMGLANYLTNGNEEALQSVAGQVKAINAEAVNNFNSIGTKASEMLQNYSTKG
ncbi:MAG: hypothetical protein ACFB10_02825, partial [Salibacteraceae bacterium]